MSCADHSGPIDYAVEREHFDGEATPQIRANPPRMPKDDEPSIAAEMIGYSCTAKYIGDTIAEVINGLAFNHENYSYHEALKKLTRCYSVMQCLVRDMRSVADRWYENIRLGRA